MRPAAGDGIGEGSVRLGVTPAFCAALACRLGVALTGVAGVLITTRTHPVAITAATAAHHTNLPNAMLFFIMSKTWKVYLTHFTTSCCEGCSVWR